MSLQDKIIKTLSKVYNDKEQLSEIRTNYLVTSIFQLLICSLIFLIGKYEDNLTTKELVPIVLPIWFITGLVIGPIFVTFMQLEPSQSLIKHYHYLLHLILPKKKQRDILIKELIEKEAQEYIKIINFLDDEKFKFVNKYNLKEWIDEYIGKERSIHNLINQRVIRKDILSMNLLYWSQMIPKKRLSVNTLRSLLLSCHITQECLNKVQHLDIDMIHRIDYLFSNYNEKEILLIFTNPYYIEDYLKVLYYSKNLSTPLPVKSNMKELHLWVTNILKYKAQGLFEFNITSDVIKRLDGHESELGKFILIKNIVELEQWGYYLSNCLKDYDKWTKELFNGNKYLFGILRNNKPYMCVKLSNKAALYEAKYAGNKYISKDNGDMEALMNTLNNIRD